MPIISRRSFLGAGSLLLAAACTRRGNAAPRDALEPTPHIHDEDDMPPVCAAAGTAANIEGPFYKRAAPHRSVLVTEADEGERFVLTGKVTAADCTPLAGAVLDVWQANARGEYDNEGFRFRGALETDAHGRYELRTIVPGRYLNGARYRPAHIHVKLRARGHRLLTTQLYFAGDPYNDGDPFIVESLIMPTRVERGVRAAQFDFVLAA